MDVIPTSVKNLVPVSNVSYITSDLSHQQVALYQLEQSLLKKYEPRGLNKAADQAALDLFIESNEQCKRWEPDESSYHYSTMLRARELLHRRFYSGSLQEPRVSLAKAIDYIVPGPGSSRGTKHTDFVGKVFNSKLTTYDKQLWEYYRSSIGSMWKLAENLRQQQYGPCEIVQSSRLTFAKKNFEISRVINTEASLDMLFQLGHAACIEECLLDWFNIDLSKQPTINRFLAKLGSMYGSDATIDLKSASDLNSQKFMKWYLPPAMYKPLDSVRAKCIELPDGNIYELGTFSTMGNGFTFPLQTLVFASIVEAAYEELGLPTWNFEVRPAFSVFGDDIICVTHAYHKVCALLEWCGFTVNKSKSFNSGSFRESCGSDFYKGRDVRGVYIKRLDHETHFYSVFNRLTRWSIRNGVDLGHCLRFIKGLVDFRPVPFDAQDGSGIKCPLSLSGKGHNSRGFVHYKSYWPRPRRKSTKDYETNPVALLVGALGGYLSGTIGTQGSKTGYLSHDSVFKPLDAPTGSITLRDKPDGDPRVKLKRCSTSSWDWIPHKGLTTLDYEIFLSDII